MTRTPDEIKKGLELCYEGIDCSECPYVDDCFGNDETPFGVVMPDARALIQQLQDDNAQLNRCIENMTDKLNAMNEEVAKLQAEKDAAVKDLETVCNMMNICRMCKDDGEGSERCEGCLMSSNWQWRGVQKEE